MTRISRSRAIRAESSAVWGVLADFGALSDWADGVDHSCLLRRGDDGTHVGIARRIQSGRDTFVETVTDYRPPTLLAYDIAGVPRGLAVANRWNVHPAAAGTTTVTLT